MNSRIARKCYFSILPRKIPSRVARDGQDPASYANWHRLAGGTDTAIARRDGASIQYSSERSIMYFRSINNKSTLTVLAFAMVFGLTACGDKGGKKPASQVAAKVNSEEISVHQVNFMLGRVASGAVSAEQAPKVRREILEKLVDQQLAVEQALEKKLDRSPNVLMALDAARRDILARAYIEQLATTAGKPTDESIKKYYADHPALFAERMVYSLQEIVLPADTGVAGPLREMVDAGKSMDEVANWLKGRGIKFVTGSATRPAEQIPLNLLPKVHALKDGQSLVIETPQNTTILRVIASQPAPVNEAAAQARIQQFIGNQRAGEVVSEEMQQLRAKAKIVYQGEFAGADVPPAAAATPVPQNDASKSKAIEKGVAGLK